MNAEEALWKDREENPEDRLSILAIADLIEESGGNSEFWRWYATTDKYPQKVKYKSGFRNKYYSTIWWNQSAYSTKENSWSLWFLGLPDKSASLPSKIFAELLGSGYGDFAYCWKDYKTVRAAEEALAAAWAWSKSHE